MWKLKAALALALLALAAQYVAGEKVEKDVTELQVGVKFKPEKCERTAQNGDNVHVHYAGRLTNGKEFDNSFKRGEPIAFRLGAGNVIKGWDQGILGMCIGEKRKLKIPPHLGYGDRGAGADIPGGSTLIFDTELVKID